MKILEITLAQDKMHISHNILHALPEWFGLPESTAEYIQESANMPFWAVESAGNIIGFIALKQHFPHAAEIYVMGILPRFHRTGAGRLLVTHALEWCRTQNIHYLQVKTLDARNPDKFYATTRLFYEATGFCELECLPTLWGENNPCLIMIQHTGLQADF